MPANRGKRWEADIGTALKAAQAWKLNQNSMHGACDWIGVYRGLAVLIECKEVHKPLISFSCITPREEREMQELHKRGGLGLITICLRLPNTSRAWAITWEDWRQMQLASGRKSVSLADPPPEFVPLSKIDRPHGLGRAWDLLPVLEPRLRRWAVQAVLDE